jgi:ubiquinol-cytochrome c reductase iron-sulfur subunit
MSEATAVNRRRRLLVISTSAVGAVGVAATAVPFVASMFPSERAKAAGAPVEVDISQLEPGMLVRVEWRNKPIWVIRRTPEMLESVRKSNALVGDPESLRAQQPEYARNEFRSIRPEILVLIGICTHLGCSPVDRMRPGGGADTPAGWLGGFYCPCHGSLFDLAGRVYRGMPAPSHLPVPPHKFLTDTRLLIGDDRKGA